MYYINKIVGFLVSPIGGAIAGGVLALLCAKRGRLRAVKWIGGITVAWLWLWMTPIMTWVVGVPLEREFLVDGKVPTVESFPEADVIVLLGGSMGIETNMSSYAEMATSADRVWQAARLFKVGKASEIIATGDYAKDTTLPLLKDFGMGEESVSFLDARTTEEEAKGLWELFSRVERVEGEEGSRKERKERKDDSRVEGGEGKILLVTSAWHMKRARLMFEKYAPGIEVVCAPADFENTFMAEKTPVFKMLLPDPNVFMLNSVAFHEWVGIVGYRVFR
ncbi:MAG: YdcF family protein [Kiritimatiellae bacterium]|nr:YdcF family protein [Kiritimatiellia bacterium]